MSRIAKQDQGLGKAQTGVAPTSGRASAPGGSASVPRAYPPLSADPPPPGARGPAFCLPPCCDFSTPSMMAEARENEIGAEIRAGGSQGAGERTRGWRARAGLAVLLATALAGVALAHEWYPLECCSARDCFSVAAEDVRITPTGYHLSDGTIVAFSETRPSPDDKFHVCRRQDGQGALIRLHKKPACFWAPVQGS